MDELSHRSERALATHGRLSTALPEFTSRSSQIHLAKAIANAIINKHTLVAEAGTGTGKTFAYLVPSLLSGKKILISTATKTLQDQLFYKDLPTLTRSLGLALQVQNLKGRANYLCQYRIQLHAEEDRFIDPQCVTELLYVREKLPQVTTGERSELPEIHEESSVWPYITSTIDNCLGKECPRYKTCYLVKARKRALEADVVVINHHMYFADSRLKEDGFSELLPKVEVIVFDEAHQLADIASQFYGERVSTRQLRDLMDDLLREWPTLDLANQPLKEYRMKLIHLVEQLWLSISSLEERVGWDKLSTTHGFKEAFEALLTFLQRWRACFDEITFEKSVGFERCITRFNQVYGLMRDFFQESNRHIRWVERFKSTLVFHKTPFEVAELFYDNLKQHSCAYIFTSATLTTMLSFDGFIRTLGLKEVQTLSLPSPFDFSKQALLYLPRGMPDPKHSAYGDALLAKALPIIKACQGRCFFLFTSHRALQQMALKLPSHLKFPILIQGDEAKSILLARFRELGNAVLLGTSTFWEGVDVKGEALSCVIIDKLPFSNPYDPIARGKMAWLKSQGLSGFDDLSLPHAILTLKQGVGRLIRDARDRGLLMIADPRLIARDYGRQIFASLPSMPRTRNKAKALQFINTLFTAPMHEE